MSLLEESKVVIKIARELDALGPAGAHRVISYLSQHFTLPMVKSKDEDNHRQSP